MTFGSTESARLEEPRLEEPRLEEPAKGRAAPPTESSDQIGFRLGGREVPSAGTSNLIRSPSQNPRPSHSDESPAGADRSVPLSKNVSWRTTLATVGIMPPNSFVMRHQSFGRSFAAISLSWRQTYLRDDLRRWNDQATLAVSNAAALELDGDARGVRENQPKRTFASRRDFDAGGPTP